MTKKKDPDEDADAIVGRMMDRQEKKDPKKDHILPFDPLSLGERILINVSHLGTAQISAGLVVQLKVAGGKDQAAVFIIDDVNDLSWIKPQLIQLLPETRVHAWKGKLEQLQWCSVERSFQPHGLF